MISDLNIFAQKWSEIAATKKVFFTDFFSFVYFLGTIFLPPLLKVECPKFVEIRNPLGKVLERSGLRFEHFKRIFALTSLSPMSKLDIFF